MRKLFLISFIFVLTSNIAFSNENFSYNMNPNYSSLYSSDSSVAVKPNLSGQKSGLVKVPAGVSFRAIFMSPISSETAIVGQEVTLAIADDFYYNNALIAPKGSSILGTVIEVSKAKHGSLNGKLTLRFTHIITPTGIDIPIAALIKTIDGSGILLGGNVIGLISGDTSLNTESFSGSKSYIPPYMGVKAGTAAAMTTAVETGGGGLLKSIWDKGQDVEIPVNTRIELVLTQPITVTPSGI